MTMNLQGPPPELREIGLQRLLLTEAESECFEIARNYQRRRLVRSLAVPELNRWRTGFNKLGWSKNSVIFGVQCLILLLALGPMLVWLGIKLSFRLFAFPFRYIKTFIVPKSLSAPGEKTLVGLHNAFSNHLNLGASDYVCCLNDWIRVLYGEAKLNEKQLSTFVNDELKTIQQHAVDEDTDLMSAHRLMVSASREKLSKALGHYGHSERIH